MIAIVDCNTGNIRSVTNALARVGYSDWVYTDGKNLLASADKVILPGVGEGADTEEFLRAVALSVENMQDCRKTRLFRWYYCYFLLSPTSKGTRTDTPHFIRSVRLGYIRSLNDCQSRCGISVHPASAKARARGKAM